VKAFGLSVAKKATAVIIKIASKKTHSASAGGSSTIQASTHVLDLFGLGSSASNDETNH
jgi:hypothetical protein